MPQAIWDHLMVGCNTWHSFRCLTDVWQVFVMFLLSHERLFGGSAVSRRIVSKVWTWEVFIFLHLSLRSWCANIFPSAFLCFSCSHKVLSPPFSYYSDCVLQHDQLITAHLSKVSVLTISFFFRSYLKGKWVGGHKRGKLRLLFRKLEDHTTRDQCVVAVWKQTAASRHRGTNTQMLRPDKPHWVRWGSSVKCQPGNGFHFPHYTMSLMQVPCCYSNQLVAKKWCIHYMKLCTVFDMCLLKAPIKYWCSLKTSYKWDLNSTTREKIPHRVNGATVTSTYELIEK